jgi:hypothetical protein
MFVEDFCGHQLLSRKWFSLWIVMKFTNFRARYEDNRNLAKQKKTVSYIYIVHWIALIFLVEWLQFRD